ncbi:MAG TPA: ATP-binding protein [Bacteroidales bacterium]|nr:ATP-binding protein [Bacteroidales bacterium]
MINRFLEKRILENLGKKKVLHIPGPRQTGKTTLLKKIASEYRQQVLWLNGDEADTRELFSNPTSTKIRTLIGKNDMVIIDEAQRIKNIGITLKIIADSLPEKKVVATGSSALELANEINEPLTGRKTELFLFPISFREMCEHTSDMEEMRMLEHRIIYGYYPEVVSSPGEEKETLARLTDAYLYKDILALEKVKRSSIIEKLLRALALQVGNQVSFNELGQIIGADNQTVERYVDLLEKAYIVFSLGSLSRNLRNELKKSRKIYFYDNGIRNALIRNFNPPELRQDIGPLWENFLISERLKSTSYNLMWMNRFFWRTLAQQEIDYVEEYDGKFYAFEFKWNEKSKGKISKTFTAAYPDNVSRIITRSNFLEFI